MITGIGHVAFRVTDLAQARDFYCNKLGFNEAFHLEMEGQPSPWIVYIQVAPGSFVELFPEAQDAPAHFRLSRLAPGLTLFPAHAERVWLSLKQDIQFLTLPTRTSA